MEKLNKTSSISFGGAVSSLLHHLCVKEGNKTLLTY